MVNEATYLAYGQIENNEENIIVQEVVELVENNEENIIVQELVELVENNEENIIVQEVVEDTDEKEITVAYRNSGDIDNWEYNSDEQPCIVTYIRLDESLTENELEECISWNSSENPWDAINDAPIKECALIEYQSSHEPDYSYEYPQFSYDYSSVISDRCGEEDSYETHKTASYIHDEYEPISCMDPRETFKYLFSIYNDGKNEKSTSNENYTDLSPKTNIPVDNSNEETYDITRNSKKCSHTSKLADSISLYDEAEAVDNTYSIDIDSNNEEYEGVSYMTARQTFKYLFQIYNNKELIIKE